MTTVVKPHTTIPYQKTYSPMNIVYSLVDSILAIHRISLPVPGVRERCGGLSAGTGWAYEYPSHNISSTPPSKGGGICHQLDTRKAESAVASQFFAALG